MSKHFTHLHLHTEYSLLDGAISLKKLIKQAQEFDLKSLAITDHGNVFGAVKFFQMAKKAGIKPILGMEAYLTEDVSVKDQGNKYYHLILLVQNKIGYRNLCKLISYSFKEGFYFKPRIDYNMLSKHSEGLIATSACLGGHIPKLLMNGQEKLADERIDWFLNTFGPEKFYLEVQPEDQKVQTTLNNKLFDLSKKRNIPLVAAGDCHYLCPEDHEAHEIMLSIQTHGKIDDPNRYSFGDCRVWMRNTDQMLEIFKDHEDAVWNAGKIADMCDFDFETDKLFFPQFEIPQKHTSETFFKELCLKGLQKLKNHNLIDISHEKEYDARLKIEMDLICKMGFVGYFLVVSDFIQWAHRQNIPVGPGRGSAAGSLVAWALQITNIDPLKYNLLFERFLNPERITMPDIDIDFCIEGREKVIDYVRDKYGHDKVCHIITFGTMMAKGVIKDVARVLGLPFEDSNAITSLIPDQLKITLKDAIEQEPRLQELIDNNPKVKKIFDIAFRLEGLTRHASKHAAGIVISPDPVDEVLPLYIPSKSKDLVAQYAMAELESIGFLKIDFLGLTNLTLIDRAVKLIKKNHNVSLDMNKLPLDNAKTFKLICAGNTSGVFQLESSGLKEVLRKLQPGKFEDIIAVNALYRPGPLGSGMVDDFIERKHGRQKITYLFDELEPILKETYGVIVYQEQVMKIASTIDGYTLGEADILRRAMGKKKVEVMAEQSKLFVSRAKEKGFNEKKAQELFDLMAYFAGYGFNKSHSAAYAFIAYQTAFLKANYSAEFLACLITLSVTNSDKMAFYLQEAKDCSIDIIPPDINTSVVEFSVVEEKILFGLHGIKNVGLAALENIIAQREKKGPFKDLFDFCKRVDLRTTNKRVVQNLICSGAFDNLPGNRAQKFEEATKIIEQAVAFKRDALTGQMGLFGAKKKDDGSENSELYTFLPISEWNDKEKLEKEKEVLEFYISSHPLETYKDQINLFAPQNFTDILSYTQKTQKAKKVLACGLIKSRRDIFTKKGDRMTFLQLEDISGTAEIVVFPKVFAQSEIWLDEHQVFLVHGFTDEASTSTCKIKANTLVPIDLAFENENKLLKDIRQIEISLSEDITTEQLEQIKKELPKGFVPLHLLFKDNEKILRLTTKEKIKINKEWLLKISKEHSVQFNIQ